MLVAYHINLNGADNVRAVREPSFDRLRCGDEVKFESNDSKIAIRFGNTSPFAEPELRPHMIFDIGNGNGKGPFRVVNVGTHHFDCGFRTPANGEFSCFGGRGGEILVDP
jgi:hypothetical protein